jgi:hypothetical protein
MTVDGLGQFGDVGAEVAGGRGKLPALAPLVSTPGSAIAAFDERCGILFHDGFHYDTPRGGVHRSQPFPTSRIQPENAEARMPLHCNLRTATGDRPTCVMEIGSLCHTR